MANGEGVKVEQELMRHANMTTTIATSTHVLCRQPNGKLKVE
jgi:hypothetical protein